MFHTTIIPLGYYGVNPIVKCNRRQIRPRHQYRFLKSFHVNVLKSRRNLNAHLLWAQLWHEVHLERIRELRRRAEGEVNILAQYLGDIRPRHFHTPGKFRMRNAQLLHPPQDTPQKCRAYSVNSLHELELRVGVGVKCAQRLSP